MRYYTRCVIKHIGKIDSEYYRTIINSIKFGLAYNEGVYMPLNGGAKEAHKVYRYLLGYSFEDDLNRNLRGVQNIKTLWTF